MNCAYLSASSRSTWVLLFVALLTTGVLLCPPVPQDPIYHQFADSRNFYGIPNFFDVVTNLAFLIVGLLGLGTCKKSAVSVERRLISIILFGSISLTAFGSAYYHLAPTSQTLAWDRLPMALGFMAFLTLVISDYWSARLAKNLIIPLSFLGGVSVLYWHVSELYGVGDLRPYLLVQYGGVLVILFILLLFPKKNKNHYYIFGTIGWYALAKVFEYYDHGTFVLLDKWISGHSLKHLFAALATYWILLYAINTKEM